MKRNVQFIIIPLLMISFAAGKTITADVTGDGVSDQITMGLRTAVVKDGATGILHTIVSEVPNLADISVGDYFHGTRGKEIAVMILSDHEYTTEVYGYRNKQFVKVSKTLPGDINFDKEDRLFGYRVHAWNGFETNIPWPVVEEGGFLKPAPLAEEIDTHDVVEAFSTDEISFIVEKQQLVVCAAAVLEKEAIVFLEDEDGTLISQKTVGARRPFIATLYADKDKTITLSIDNSQSQDQKTVHYLIRHFTVPVIKK
jgi:hypothetical protein